MIEEKIKDIVKAENKSKEIILLAQKESKEIIERGEESIQKIKQDMIESFKIEKKERLLQAENLSNIVYKETLENLNNEFLEKNKNLQTKIEEERQKIKKEILDKWL